MHRGGNSACVLNAANEVAVDAFLKDKIGFLEMSDVVEKSLEKISLIKNPDYEAYVDTDKETRKFAGSLI
jgi:1-deoxy-D-xylulose-5-phosphate reductoisomerase